MWRRYISCLCFPLKVYIVQLRVWLCSPIIIPGRNNIRHTVEKVMLSIIDQKPYLSNRSTGTKGICQAVSALFIQHTVKGPHWLEDTSSIHKASYL